jgi:hypothetical protein
MIVPSRRLVPTEAMSLTFLPDRPIVDAMDRPFGGPDDLTSSGRSA